MNGKRVRVPLLLFLSAVMLFTFSLHVYYNAFYTTPFFRPGRVVDAALDVDRLTIRKVYDPRFRDMGMEEGDVLYATVDSSGREWPIRSPDSLGDAANAVKWGEPWELLVLRKGPGVRERLVTLPMPAEEKIPSQWLRRLPPLLPIALLSLLCLATALAIGFAKAEDDGAYTASLLFVCVPSFLLSLWAGRWPYFPPGIREATVIVWCYLHGLTMFVFLRFFLLFPTPSPMERRAPWLRRWALFTSLVFATWNVAWWFAQQKSPAFWGDFFRHLDWLDITQDVLFVTLFGIGLASLGLNIQEAKTPDERRRLNLLLWGSFGIIPSLLLWLANVTLRVGLPFPVVLVIMVAGFSFPVCFLVAVVKHRIFGIRFILRRGLQFALLSRGFLLLEGLAIFFLLYYAAAPTLAAALGGAGQSLVAITTAGAAACAVLGIRQLNRRVMPRIEKRFFREAYDTRRILTGLTLGVRRFVTDPEALAQTVTRTVSDALHPASAVLFLRVAKALELPWSQERMRTLRRTSGGAAPQDFLIVWPRENGNGAVLQGGSLAVRLLEECALGDPSVLDVDPGRARSRWPLLKSQGTPEEKTLLESLDAHLLVPMAVEERLTGFLLLGDKLSEEPYSREDAELLLAVAQQAADTLDHAALLRQSQEQAQLKREVEIAMQVQENLLPREVIPVPNIEYAGACRPARYVGGDYYDFILRGGGRLVLALGDISGKGVSAALLMANLQANLRVQADLHGDRLEDVVSAINQRLCAATGESRFATLFYGIFDSEKRTLDYVNAGHNPPILFRPSAGERALTQLDPTGSILGIFGDLEYRRHAVQLEPGDLLIVYSDGATEAMNEAEEFFGEERLKELVATFAELPPRAVVQKVLEEVGRFSGERPQADDITLIAARIL